MEMFPLVIAITVWMQSLAHRKFIFGVVNMAVVQVVNKQSARDEQVLKLMRVFILSCLKCDKQLRPKHIPGVDNDIADALSRSQWGRFHGLATEMEFQKTLDAATDGRAIRSFYETGIWPGSGRPL